MQKLFRFILVGLISIFLTAFSFSVCAKKGGIPGGGGMPGKGNIINKAGGFEKGYKPFESKEEQKFYELKSGKINKKFSDVDRKTITNFFSTNPISATTLPPGIAKNLARGKPLPPGIAKVFLPQGLLDSLEIYPGYDYLIAGRDVLLVNRSTQVIADILSNILR